MGDHGGPWGTMGDRGNQLEPAGTLESQPGVLDDGMQNSALGCMISRLYQCFSFVAREFSPRNDQTPVYKDLPELATSLIGTARALKILAVTSAHVHKGCGGW